MHHHDIRIQFSIIIKTLITFFLISSMTSAQSNIILDYCNEKWQLDLNNIYEGVESLVSGDVYCSDSRLKSKCVKGKVSGPGEIEFAWMKGEDFAHFTNFSFYIDDVWKVSCDSLSWKKINWPIGEGEHELKWDIRMIGAHLNEPCISGNHGKAWINNIRYFSINNTSPSIPIISVPDSGLNNNTQCVVSASSIDPNGDKVRIEFNFGDGSNLTKTDLTISGASTSTSHIWEIPGDYEIRARAIDEKGLSSNWSTSEYVKIGCIIHVPQISNKQLQNIIDACPTNTTLILDGTEYEGPIEIKIKNLTIKSPNSASINGRGNKYNIGIDNTSGINICDINLYNSYEGIHIQYSHECYINPGKIEFIFGNGYSYGVYLENSQKNKISAQLVSEDVSDESVGIHLVNSKKNYLNCRFFLKNDQNICLTDDSCMNQIDVSEMYNGKILDDYKAFVIENGVINSSSGWAREESCNYWMGL